MVIPQGLLILFLLILSVFAVYLGTLGLDDRSLREPFAFWRKAIKWFLAHFLLRSVFFFAGFRWITTKGKKATPEEASVLVVAPHSSYFDAFPVTVLGGPSVVGKQDARKTWFWGTLIDFTQPIYVDRSDPNSKQHCKQEIRRRTNLGEDKLPQILIFPEGTCSNRAALAQFNLGAFEPGVPVQPVVIKYPNKLDCVSWTWDGPSALFTGLFALSRFRNYMEIEFLPVYRPTPEEQGNAKLFANNVQKVMADAMGIPATDYTIKDGFAIAKFAKSRIRQKLNLIWKIKGEMRSRDSSSPESEILRDCVGLENFEWHVPPQNFRDLLKANAEGKKHITEAIAELGRLFQHDNEETIDLRPYLVLSYLFYTASKLEVLEALMFKMYTKNQSRMTQKEFANLTQSVFELKEKDADDLFFAGSNGNANRTDVTYGEFQQKIRKRLEFMKLYAMEECGALSGDYPSFAMRDHLDPIKRKAD